MTEKNKNKSIKEILSLIYTYITVFFFISFVIFYRRKPITRNHTPNIPQGCQGSFHEPPFLTLPETPSFTLTELSRTAPPQFLALGEPFDDDDFDFLEFLKRRDDL